MNSIFHVEFLHCKNDVTPHEAFLHLMHRGIGSPPSEPLSVHVEGNRTETPERRQAHVQHDWFDVPTLLNPWGDKLAEAVSPQVLIDGDRNEDRACDGLVAVHRISACDGR